MLKINFYPDSDRSEFVTAIKEFEKIWQTDGEKIVEAIQKVSGLTFQENTLTAVIYDGISSANPLRFRASLPTENKKSTLIHQLSHRLLQGNKIGTATKLGPEFVEQVHRELNLILYDIYFDLYGQAFADKHVETEKLLGETYANAWDWALGKSRDERRLAFEELLLVR